MELLVHTMQLIQYRNNIAISVYDFCNAKQVVAYESVLASVTMRIGNNASSSRMGLVV